jgi:outer membrane protein TolC
VARFLHEVRITCSGEAKVPIERNGPKEPSLDLVATKVPPRYTSAPTLGIAKDMSSLAEWWNNFQDSELQSLIQGAIVSNLDVRIARAKLRQSRATLRCGSGSSNAQYATKGKYTLTIVGTDTSSSSITLPTTMTLTIE